MIDLTQLRETPHRRFNPLTREWVLVSPHRTQRPWQGKVETLPSNDQPAYDSDCYLCPGNSRAGGASNPKYESTFVFDNDYAAMKPDIADASLDESDLLIARTERGICRVGCFSPRHDLTIARMTVEELRVVVDMWIEQYEQLGAIPWVDNVQIFENRGAMMGASNPHPHCQIWSNATIPHEVSREQQTQNDYAKAHGSCMLCDYLKLEEAAKDRIVCENQAFIALIPFWAVWPFEAMILSRRHAPSMPDFDDRERTLLGDIVKQLTTRYDNLFQVSFPYTMGFHQSPTDGQLHPEWHFHAHYLPPLLRSAAVQKFMVGYELLDMPQRDITPESAAERLRLLPAIHYHERR